MKTKSREALVLACLGAAAVAYVVVLYLPNRAAIARTLEQVESKRREVAQAALLAPTLLQTQQDLARTKARLADWDAKSTEARETAVLFGRINQMIRASGAVTGRFGPEPIRRRDRIVEIPLSVGLTGTFSQILEFLHSLEGLPATIWVDSMKLEGSGKSRGDVRGEIKMVVFAGNSENSDYAKLSTQPIK